MFAKLGKSHANTMARKTKEEALATRARLLDAAERRFQQHGVAGTTLQDIAQAAGLTRGAVYWHFEDKADLFNAMLDRVVLPMEDCLGPDTESESDPEVLPALRARLLMALTRIADSEQMQRVLEIVLFKSEYTDDMSAARERRLQLRRDFSAGLQAALAAGQARGEVTRAVPSTVLAAGLHALMDGLIQDWLLDGAHDLPARGAQVLDICFAGLRTPAPPATKARRRT